MGQTVTSVTLGHQRGMNKKITSEKNKPQTEITLRGKLWVVQELLFVSPVKYIYIYIYFLSFYVILEQCFQKSLFLKTLFKKPVNRP